MGFRTLGDGMSQERPVVALLTGGSTPERPVALAGARQVAEALRSRAFEVRVFDTCSGFLRETEEALTLRDSVTRMTPSLEELAALERQEDLLTLMTSEALRTADVVWPLLHGLQGEGGEVQSLLEANGMPFVGSDARGSTLAMDKGVSKILMQAAGVPTASWLLWRAGDPLPAELELPVVVKPSRVGSTVGLSVVRTGEALDAALRLAIGYDDEVLLEKFLPGRELTVGVLRDQALIVGEITTVGDVFDFESKYQPGVASEIFPAEIPRELAEEVQALAITVHRALKLRDLSRVDFRLDGEGAPLCLEANTLPGMTPTSLLPQSAAAAGIGFADLCELLVELAYERLSQG